MKNKKILAIVGIGVIVFILVFFVFPLSKTKTNNPSSSHRSLKSNKTSSKHYFTTAKEAYKLSQKKASQWDKNAYLIDIEQFMGSDRKDGKTDFWEFKYTSDDKKTAYRVKVADGKVTAAGEYAGRDKKYLGRVPDNWIDSDQAIKIALDNLKEIKCKSYWLGLSGKEWSVKCRKVEGGKPRWVEIDAVTGKFIRFRDTY